MIDGLLMCINTALETAHYSFLPSRARTLGRRESFALALEVRGRYQDTYAITINKGENRIQWLKRQTMAILRSTGAPLDLVFHAMKWVAEVHNHSGQTCCGGRSPIEKVFGDTPDATHIAQFDFYGRGNLSDRARVPRQHLLSLFLL